MLTVTEALQQIQNTITPANPVAMPLTLALGCTLATDIVAAVDSPPFDKSLMDGFAVRAGDVNPGVRLNVLERLTAGQVPRFPLQRMHTTQVMTGTQLPDGTDAVVQIEDVIHPEQSPISLRIAQIAPGRNMMRRGESLQAGETVLTAGTALTFSQIGVLAELGHAEVPVFPRPEVAVLATGNELVTVAETPGPGQIRNSNEPLLLAQLQACGVRSNPLGIARDDRDDLKAKIQQGLQSDFLILSGGGSAGLLDLVPQALQDCGVQQIFHKVQMKPGKPLWFGHKPAKSGQKGCYVFGLPGNPVSTLVCFELFVKAALHLFQGLSPATAVQAELTQTHLVKGDRPVYHPARWSLSDSKLVVRPVRWVGSADLRGTAEANGMIHFEPRETPYGPGELVPLFPWQTAFPAS